MKLAPAELATIWQMLRGQPAGGTQATRLQRFYAPQAQHYDSFRERLLHGRRELAAMLPTPPGSRIVELGGGTARNLEFFGARIRHCASFEVVDLCPALLALARARCAGWTNVTVTEGDARTWQPSAPVDSVYFSYALSMIPDWQHALANALRMLKPGGTVGVVDFYLSAHAYGLGIKHHHALARLFWCRWFAHDGVDLDAERLRRLHSVTQRVYLYQGRASVPYIPGLRVPYFIYLGVKPPAARHADE